MFSIHELRQEAYENWECMCSNNDVTMDVPFTHEVSKEQGERFPYTNESFKAEVRQRFGDLRRRETWEKAAISFTAHSVAHSYLEAHEILTYMVRPALPSGIPRGEVWDAYADRIFDEILSFPGIDELIKLGLEQLYRESDRREDREVAIDFLQQARDRFPLLALPEAIARQTA